MIQLKNGRIIGKGQPTYIIAEMSANHAGDFQRAKDIIIAAKNAGADCIKLQLYTADTLTIDCHNEYFNIKQGTWDGENLYDLYKKAYTPWEWFEELKTIADDLDIDFLVTPFDNSSVDFLEALGVEFYKIASFEAIDIPLISYIASKNKPIILSTGMATIDEINEAVQCIQKNGQSSLALLKCTSAYPANYAEMNLKTISHMAEMFDCPVGLSDHSMGASVPIAATVLGASIIEKHFCISREIENPDASFSMEMDEFSQMVREIRQVEKAIGKVLYGVSSDEEKSKMFRRSLFIVKDIDEGELFTPDNVRSIRPGFGLKPKYINHVIGKTAKYPIKKGTPMSWELIL